MKMTNLDYLKSHSPNNPKFVVTILQMILEQIPPVFIEMEKALVNADWNILCGSIHKIRPTIGLIGMPQVILTSAKEIEDYSREQVHLDLVPALFLKLDTAFKQVYSELEEELEKENTTPT